MAQTITPQNSDRMQRIEQARQQALHQATALDPLLIEPWIARSWQRCLALGLQPQQHVNFDAVSAPAMRRTEVANRHLVQAARPVLEHLGRAMLDTRYFAILTNQNGIVIDAHGPIDRSDRRADLITRVGVDLSEPSVGTTAIGAALTEMAPVWLHRGEHFFDDTSVYSCAGAPLFGPQGDCVGMLDLTGVQAQERPELRHLVVHAARLIENALTLQQSHSVLLRLNWPGRALGDEADGLIGLNVDGVVVCANSAARQLLPELNQRRATPWHSSDLFALPFEKFFDAARHGATAVEVPLWSGLRLQVLARNRQGCAVTINAATSATAWNSQVAESSPLKEVESALIRKAVQDARGNVAQAAQALGISRATVYRKLGPARK
jgi:transcriptional regulator of acetoin/glycerol metabolism